MSKKAIKQIRFATFAIAGIVVVIAIGLMYLSSLIYVVGDWSNDPVDTLDSVEVESIIINRHYVLSAEDSLAYADFVKQLNE
jgi:predicted RND superfamily exporter protein